MFEDIMILAHLGAHSTITASSTLITRSTLGDTFSEVKLVLITSYVKVHY